MKITLDQDGSSTHITLHDNKGRWSESYVAKDTGSALLITASLLKELDPPKHYNKKAKLAR